MVATIRIFSREGFVRSCGMTVEASPAGMAAGAPFKSAAGQARLSHFSPAEQKIDPNLTSARQTPGYAAVAALAHLDGLNNLLEQLDMPKLHGISFEFEDSGDAIAIGRPGKTTMPGTFVESLLRRSARAIGWTWLMDQAPLGVVVMGYFRDSDGKASAQMQDGDIVIHELAHALVQMLVPGHLEHDERYSNGFQDRLGLSESFADALAAVYFDDPNIGEDTVVLEGNNEPFSLRRIDRLPGRDLNTPDIASRLLSGRYHRYYAHAFWAVYRALQRVRPESAKLDAMATMIGVVQRLDWKGSDLIPFESLLRASLSTRVGEALARKVADAALAPKAAPANSVPRMKQEMNFGVCPPAPRSSR